MSFLLEHIQFLLSSEQFSHNYSQVVIKMIIMKSFVLLSALTIGLCAARQVVHLTAEQNARLLPMAMQCIVESGVNPDVIVEVKADKYSDDENFKKFLYCVFRKAGVGSKDGHFKVDKVLEIYPNNIEKEPIKKVLEDCNKLDGKNNVDRAFNVFKCYHANSPVHILF